MSNSWNYDRALEQIDKRMADVETVIIKEYGRDLTLESIPTNTAYRVDAVHLYADILNIGEMLNVTKFEGTDCHKRTLRFLDQHYRAVQRVLDAVDAKRIDFHNQRLHAIFAKPYNTEEDAEKSRIQRAVATAQLMIDVLAQTSDLDEGVPAAKVRVGIDSGRALAVNNGRNGYREPLFLGNPANHAAKLASNSAVEGIYLTNVARSKLGLEESAKPEKVALSAEEIAACQDAASLEITVDAIVKTWKDDLANNPIGSFEFFRHTPPLSTMDIASLTPANSRRQEAVSMYADIDGFTGYVAEHIDENTEDIVRVLHVVRAELERVLTSEFGGRRARFIGDCVHGLICEGTAHSTDEHASVTTATLLAGALRSSFELCLERLQSAGRSTGTLGLAIGFDFGPVSVTRLGKKGHRVRCAISRNVLESEVQQARCSGTETAIGTSAFDVASDAVRELFGSKRRVADLDYNEAVEALADKGEPSANVVRDAIAGAPAIIRAESREVQPYTRAPQY